MEHVANKRKGIVVDDPTNWDHTTEDRKLNVPINGEDQFVFMEAAYWGDGHFRTGKYLVPHHRERFYVTRMLLAYYSNFLKPIINASFRPVFANDIPRIVRVKNSETTTENFFTEYLKNADNQGNSQHRTMRKGARLANLHGLAYIVMDNFMADEQPATTQEAKDNRIFPYIFYKQKNEVLSSVTDKHGNLQEITFIEDPIMIEGKEEKRFRIWTREFSQILKLADEVVVKGKKPTLIPVSEPFFHNLGVLPVYPMYAIERTNTTRPWVESANYDIAKLNWTIFNQDSELRELQRNQGFSVFYSQGDSGTDKTGGTYNMFNVDESAKFPPGFASPDSAIPSSLQDARERVRENMFTIAEQNGIIAIQTRNSGVSKEWDFVAYAFVLRDTRDMILAAERWIHMVFSLYVDEESDYDPQYQKEFQPRARQFELDVLERLNDIGFGPKGRNLIKKRAFQTVFHDSTQKELAPIIEEIEQGKADEIQGGSSHLDTPKDRDKE